MTNEIQLLNIKKSSLRESLMKLSDTCNNLIYEINRTVRFIDEIESILSSNTLEEREINSAEGR